MLFYFYNLMLYSLLILFLPALLLWRASAPKHAAGWIQKLSGSIVFKPKPDCPTRIVFHAVSVGELIAARPLINWLNEQSQTQVIITSTTQTGYDLAEKIFPKNAHYFLPYDLPHAVARFLNTIRPTAVLVMETELWPNLAWACKAKDIILLLVNGRLSERSFKRYKYISFLMRYTLSCFSACFMQTPEDAKRIIELGAQDDKVQVLGNLKFIPVVGNSVNSDTEVIIQQIQSAWCDSPIILVASTHAGEEELFIGAYHLLRLKYPNTKLIIAPRHPERFDAVYKLLENELTQGITRRSAISSIPICDCVLLDSIGELSVFYKLATVVIMAGSFIWHGGHNILEPMAHQIPVITGPYMKNFKAITCMAKENHALIQLKDILPETIFNCIDDLLSHPDKGAILSQNSQLLIQQNADIEMKYRQVLEKMIWTTI